MGYALVPLVDQAQGGQLLQRIRALRRHLALQLGFMVPSVHITDNLKLKPREYVIYLRGVEIARWEIYQDRVLAISSEPNPAALDGFDTREPAFGTAAKWIAPGLQELALHQGLRGGGSDLRAGHPHRRGHAPARPRTAHPPGNQAPAGRAGREPAQAGGRTRAAPAEPGRSAEGAAAVAARTGLGSRPHHDFGSAARYRRNEQVAGGAGGSHPAGPRAARWCSRCWARTASSRC